MQKYIELAEQYLVLLSVCRDVTWRPAANNGIDLAFIAPDQRVGGYLQGFYAATHEAFGTPFDSYVTQRIKQTYPQA